MADAFHIAIDLSALMPLAGPITNAEFPHLALAVTAIADRVERRWKTYAAGAPMPNGKTINNRTGEYVRSIMQRQTGHFAAEVYTDLPYAGVIEHGAPRHDMKTMLNSSLKVRISAAGRRYLIIPFRHGHPGNVIGDSPMSDAVSAWWTDKKASSVRGMGSRLSGTGAMDIKTRKPLTVAARSYAWGDRLSRGALASLGASDHETKRMQGMVMFRRPGKTGGASHSQFITFRVMSENSKGWIAPATEGKWPARTTSEIYKPLAEAIFRAAVAEDIKALLPGVSTD